MNKKIKYIIIIIIFILLAIFLVKFVRNAIIITGLIKESKQYDECQNFYIRESIYTSEGISIYETYFKNGKCIQTRYCFNINQIETEENVLKAIDYCDENGNYTTYYVNEKKYYKTSIDELSIMTHPSNFSGLQELERDRKSFIRACFEYKIASEKCNGKECYRFNKSDNGITFFNKDTGLMMRNETKGEDDDLDTTYDIQFEFGIAKDDDFIEPDITEYTLIQEDD